MVTLILLARILDPSDFGLFALAMLVFATIGIFSDLGMASAVIHSRSDRQQSAFQAFWLTICLNLLLVLLLNLQATPLAAWLGQPGLAVVLHWISLMVFLEALSLIPNALLSKEMRFGQISKAMIIANTVDNVTSLLFAVLGFGLWSLVYGKLIGTTTKLAFTWAAHARWEWLTGAGWDWRLMRDLVRYGGKGTLAGLMDFVNSHWDDWLVGTMLGATALGFYDRSYGLTNGTIVGMNTNILSSVLFPSYTQLRDEPERLSVAYIKSLRFSTLLMAPIALGLLAVAPELVRLVFGDKWLSMITTLQIFAVMAFVRPLAGTTSPLFRALGRPDYDFRAGLSVAVIMVPLALYGLRWGIEGVAAAVTIGYMGGLLFNIYQVHSLLPNTADKMLPAMLPATAASLVMVGGLYLLRSFGLAAVEQISVLLSTLILIGCGALFYLLASLLLQRTLIIELWALLNTMRQPLMQRLQRKPVVAPVNNSTQGLAHE